MLSNRLVYDKYSKTLFGCVVIDPDELTGDTRRKYINSHGHSYLTECADDTGWTLEEAGVSLVYDILSKKYPASDIEARTFWFININDNEYFIKNTDKILENE